MWARMGAKLVKATSPRPVSTDSSVAIEAAFSLVVSIGTPDHLSHPQVDTGLRDVRRDASPSSSRMNTFADRPCSCARVRT